MRNFPGQVAQDCHQSGCESEMKGDFFSSGDLNPFSCVDKSDEISLSG